MLVYQNKKVGDVFYGSRKIKKVYLGDKKIFGLQKFSGMVYSSYSGFAVCIDNQVYLYSKNDVSDGRVTMKKLDNGVVDRIRPADTFKGSYGFNTLSSGVVRCFDNDGTLLYEWPEKWDNIFDTNVFVRGTDFYHCDMGNGPTKEPELLLSGATFINDSPMLHFTGIIAQTTDKVYFVYPYGANEIEGISPGLDWGVFIEVPGGGGGTYIAFLASYSGTLVLYYHNTQGYVEGWRSSDGIDYSKMELIPESNMNNFIMYGILDGKLLRIDPIYNQEFSCKVTTWLGNCTKADYPYAICEGEVKYFAYDRTDAFPPMYPPSPRDYIDLIGDPFVMIYRTADDRFFQVSSKNYGGNFELFLPS